MLSRLTFSIILSRHHAAYFARANTSAYCKSFGWGLFSEKHMATILGVSQWCISKILRHNRNKHCSATLVEAWRSEESDHSLREDRQLIRMVRDNRFISAPRLCVGMIRRFQRSLSVGGVIHRLLAAVYQSRRPFRCLTLTLDHRVCHVLGKTDRRWDLRH